jgi:hypothetical protein
MSLLLKAAFVVALGVWAPTLMVIIVIVYCTRPRKHRQRI